MTASMHCVSPVIEESMNIDLLIIHAAQLITVPSPGGPKRGAAMRELGAIRDGALAITGGRIVAVGTTTAQAKSGYGLTTPAELKMLRVIDTLNAAQPLELVPTFLGAHALPAEYADRTDEYLALVVDEMLPALRARGGPLPFVDIFCDEGAFTPAQLERVLGAAPSLGFPLKAALGEF